MEQNPFAESGTSPTPLLLRATEVARLLGLGRSKVYEMMTSGTLPVTRIGTAVRVPRAQLEDWINDHTSEAA
jgi:excisionase family DNA binding protein